MAAVGGSSVDKFAFDISPNPWEDPHNFTPFDDVTSELLAVRVQAVCSGREGSALVPINPVGATSHHYFVAVCRGPREGCRDSPFFEVNLVQFRMDFASGTSVSRERAISVPASIVAQFRHLAFV